MKPHKKGRVLKIRKICSTFDLFGQHFLNFCLQKPQAKAFKIVGTFTLFQFLILKNLMFFKLKMFCHTGYKN